MTIIVGKCNNECNPAFIEISNVSGNTKCEAQSISAGHKGSVNFPIDYDEDVYTSDEFSDYYFLTVERLFFSGEYVRFTGWNIGANSTYNGNTGLYLSINIYNDTSSSISFCCYYYILFVRRRWRLGE